MDKNKKTTFAHPEVLVVYLEKRLAVLQEKIKKLEAENLQWRQKAESLKVELESLENK